MLIDFIRFERTGFLFFVPISPEHNLCPLFASPFLRRVWHQEAASTPPGVPEQDEAVRPVGRQWALHEGARLHVQTVPQKLRHVHRRTGHRDQRSVGCSSLFLVTITKCESRKRLTIFFCCRDDVIFGRQRVDPNTILKLRVPR